MSLINSKNIKSFYEQEQKNLVPPDIYQFNVPSTLTSTTAINAYAGITMDTFYKGDPEYISLARKYLNFKTVILKTNFIPAEGSINPADITTVSGYDESISAIKNITNIFGNDQVLKYSNYLQYIDDYMGAKTDSIVDSFEEFYKNNTSFTSNTIDYVDSIHVFTLTTKLFKYSSLVDLTNTDFVILKLDDVYFRVGNLLKYNIINDLKYRDLTCYDDSKVSILCGVVYEDGTIIISVPFILNPNSMTSTNIKATCLGSLSGSNKIVYTFNYVGGSVTGALASNQKLYKTTDGGTSWSTLTSGATYPQFLIKDFSDALTSVSAALSSEAFSNVASSSARVNWSVTGASVAGYMVLSSSGTVTFAPTDSVTSYTQGTTAADGSLIILYATTTSVTAASTGMTQGIPYNFSVIPFFGSPRNYYSPALNFSYTLLATIPTNQPTALTGTSISPTGVTISFAAAAGGADKYLTRYGTITVTGDPVDAIGYSVGNTLGSGTIVATGSSTSFAISGLTPQTLYYWLAQSYNGAVSTAYKYLTTTGVSNTTNFYTLSTEPVSTPSAFALVSRVPTAITISFTTAGSVSGYLTMRKSGSVPNPTIADGIAYSNGATMTGDSSVSVSSSTSLTIANTSLTPDTEYYFKVVSYNQLPSQATTTNYLTANSLTGSIWTLASAPTGQPSSIIFSSRLTTGATVAWTAAVTAERYFSLYKAGSLPTATPITGVHYSSGALFPASATDFVSGTGTGVSVALTSLLIGSLYYVSVMSYNGQLRSGTTGTENYLTTTPLTGSFWTLTSEPTGIATNNGTTSTSASISISFTAGTPAYSGHSTLRKVSVVPDETLLVDGNIYADGANLGSNTFSITSGTQQVIANTSLATKTQYFFKVVSYNVGSNTATTNFLLSSYLSLSAWTLDTEPSAAPSSMAVSARTTSSATLTFTAAPSTTGSIALLKTSSISDVPIDGTFYSAGNTIGSSTVTALGTAMTTFSPTGLALGTEYFYKLFSYNWGNNTLTVNYFSTSSLSGSFWTLTSEPTSIASNLVMAIPTTASQDMTFTMPTATHVFVEFKASSIPTGTPVDGGIYADYTSLGDSTVASGSLVAGALSVTGLSPGVNYFYKIISQNRGSNTATTNYWTVSSLTGSKYTQKVAPADSSIASISLVSVSSRSISSITVSWTKGSADGTIATSRYGTWPNNPVNGTYYLVGDIISSSTVSFTGTGTVSQTISGLTAGDHSWFIQFYAYNEPWINYNLISFAQFQCMTLATKPTNPPVISSVTGISVSSGVINFSNYGNGNAIFVIASANTDFSTETPDDGQYYTPGNTFGVGKVVDITATGSSIAYASSSNLNSLIYVRAYSVSGQNTIGNTNATSNAFKTNVISTTSFWTLASTPDTPPVDSFDVGAASIGSATAVWSAPTGNYNGFMLLKRRGSSASASIDEMPTLAISAYSVGMYLGLSEIIDIAYPTLHYSFTDNFVVARYYDTFKGWWIGPGDKLRYRIISIQTSGPINTAYAQGEEVYINELTFGTEI